jgi:hypothetical protein
MRRGFLRVSIFSIVWAVLVAACGAAEFSGVVERVIDGDDIVLCDDDGSCRRIRLCGIDAPERTCAGYKASRDALRDFAEGNAARCVQVGGGTLAMEDRSQKAANALSPNVLLRTLTLLPVKSNKAWRAIGRCIRTDTIHVMALAARVPRIIVAPAWQWCPRSHPRRLCPPSR